MGFKPTQLQWDAFRLTCSLLALLMVFSLFYVGSKPVAVGLFHPPWDKVAHGVTFSAIAVLFWISANGRRPVLIALVVIAIGGLDELHQIFLPGRSADWADFLVDFLAAAGAIGLLSLLIRVPWVEDD